MKLLRWLLAGGIASLVLLQTLAAETLEEVYQSALMAEKGKGDLTEAMRLYKKIAAVTGEEFAALAARAQIRLGICEEKLGLKKARRVFQQVPEQFSDQPEAVMQAAEQIQQLKKIEKIIEHTDAVREEAPYGQFDESPVVGWHENFPGSGILGQLDHLTENLEHLSQDVANQAVAAVQAMPFFGPRGRRYANYAYAEPVLPYEYRRVAEVPEKWKFLLDLEDFEPPGLAKGTEYSNSSFDDGHWADIQIGQAWEDQGYERYDLGAWYRAVIEVDAQDDEAPVYMGFGGIDLHGYVYINGKLVGEHHVWNSPFILDISDAVERRGKNAVAIYVYDGVGMGGIYGMIDIHQPLEKTDLDHFIANRGGSINQHAHHYKATRDAYFKKWQRHHKSSADASAGRPKYASYAGAIPRVPYAHKEVAEVPAKWKFNLDFGTLPASQRAAITQGNYDDAHWPEIAIGQAWEDQGYPGYDEGAWYRTKVTVEAEEGKPVYMAFGGVDKDAWVYVNGQLVGQHRVWNRSFVVDISDAVNYSGENVIVVRVYDGMGMGGIYGLVSIHQPTSRSHSVR